MKKIVVVMVSVFSALAVTSLVIFIFLTQVGANMPKELEYPVSGLSESIFDSQGQNMKYTPNESLTSLHAYTQSPYTFDTIDEERADLGECGVVYKVDNATYIYTTEVPRGKSIDTLIKDELSQAVMVDARTEMSVVDNLIFDEGYKNGFKADYYIDRLTVSNTTRSCSVYLTGYMLTITDAETFHGYDLFISIVTAQATTEGLVRAKDMLDTLVGTFQYDEKKQKEMVAAEEEEQRQIEKMGSDTSISTSGDSNTDMGAYSSTQEGSVETNYDDYVTDGDSTIPKQKEKAISISESYENVSLYYYYSNADETLNLTLHNPSATEDFAPVSIENGVAIFKLDTMEVGKWHMTVIGNPGTESIKLHSEIMEEE